jgi:hypothetical protein
MEPPAKRVRTDMEPIESNGVAKEHVEPSPSNSQAMRDNDRSKKGIAAIKPEYVV